MSQHDKLTDNDDCATPPRPDTLAMFLNSVIPTAPMIAHMRNSIPDTIKLNPRYPRRPYEAIVASQSNDFADWTVAHAELFQAKQQAAAVRQLEPVPVEKRQELYIGRWLRTRSTNNNPMSPPLIRPRLSSTDHSQKRYKPGPFGEVRQPSARSFVGTASDQRRSVLRTGVSPPSRQSDSNQSRSGVPNPRDGLHSVGGVERILCHAAAYIAPCVYVFGGLTKNGCSDRMWSLLPSESGWRYVEAVGDQRPSSRYGHTLVAWRKQLVLFGGDGGPGYLDDLWYFDTVKHEWDRISLEQEQEGRRPGARTGHSAAVYGDHMLIFGGWRGGDGFSDVWSCDLKARNWDLLHYRAGGQGRELKRTVIEGVVYGSEESPEPRQWHICGVFDDYMYIHGGYGFGGVLRHVWRFHIPSRVWEFVQTKGTEPAARCRHSGVVVDDDKWVVFGGKDAEGSYFCDMFVLDVKSHTWRSVSLFSPPEPISTAEAEWWNCLDILRELPYLHCQATAYDHENKCIVITGGCNGEIAAYDSTILLKRYCSAALLFEEWISKRPQRVSEPMGMDLPEFLHRNPEPAAREILRYL